MAPGGERPRGNAVPVGRCTGGRTASRLAPGGRRGSTEAAEVLAVAGPGGDGTSRAPLRPRDRETREQTRAFDGCDVWTRPSKTGFGARSTRDRTLDHHRGPGVYTNLSCGAVTGAEELRSWKARLCL
jgi:hypothetical protein